MCVSNLLILSFPNTLNFSASFDVTEDNCTASPPSRRMERPSKAPRFSSRTVVLTTSACLWINRTQPTATTASLHLKACSRPGLRTPLTAPSPPRQLQPRQLQLSFPLSLRPPCLSLRPRHQILNRVAILTIMVVGVTARIAAPTVLVRRVALAIPLIGTKSLRFSFPCYASFALSRC